MTADRYQQELRRLLAVFQAAVRPTGRARGGVPPRARLLERGWRI